MIGFTKSGDLAVSITLCRRCKGNRLYVDFTKELQCIDCDPPHRVYREKLEAAKLKKLAQSAQMQHMEDEDREEEEASKERKVIILPGE